jgi:glyoxylate reductase
VFENEPAVHPGLMGRDDVVLLPHLGSSTQETRERMARIALEQVERVLRGERPTTPVNDLAKR